MKLSRCVRRLAAVVLGTLLLASGADGAPAKKAPFPHARIGVANGCFVESVAFGDTLQELFGGETWYRVLQWGAKEDDEVVAGHAVTVFDYKGKLWSYDINYGFTQLATDLAHREDVATVAKEVTAPYLARVTPRYPLYRQDFRQPPDGKIPAPFDGVVDTNLRDAGLVAERLAKHRPVALVEFTYPKGDETVRSAAAVFVYGGRLCVYTSENGTVPFRTTMLSVRNLRQLQDLLRRVYPGATGLKPR